MWNPEAVTWDEYDFFVATIKGPCVIKIHDGDYDYAIIWPDGFSVDAMKYDPGFTMDQVRKFEK